MSRVTSLLLSASFLAITGALPVVPSGDAFAGWKEDQAICEAGGGVWSGPAGGGDVGCVTIDPVGNSDNPGRGQDKGNAQEDETVDTSKGHLDNNPQSDCDSSGPGNSPGSGC